MNKREDDILRYVSNEMTEAERQQFEQKLSEDIRLRAEVDELLATQKRLKEWPEEEFDIPSLSELETGKSSPKVKLLSRFPRRWMSYAAAFLLLFGFAWLSDLQITQKDHALILSFGPAEPPTTYQPDQVAQIVEKAVAKYAAQANAQEQAEEATKQQQWNQLEQEMTGRVMSLYQQEITKIRQQLNDHERRQLLATEQLVQGLQFEQRVMLQEAIYAVLDQLEQQRQEDRMDLAKAFQQINALLLDFQNGGGMVADGDMGVRHY